MNIYTAEQYDPCEATWIVKDVFLCARDAKTLAEGRQHRAVRCGKQTEYWRVMRAEVPSENATHKLLWGPALVAMEECG